MKTKSLLLSLILVVGVLAFNSCSKEDDPAPLTKENAELAVDDASADFETTTTDLLANDGFALQEQLYDMYLPFYNTKKVSKKTFGNVDVDALKKKASDYFNLSKREYFNFHFNYLFKIYFDGNTGTWEWTNGEFVKTSDLPADQIVAKFPYNSETNNATLRYYDYKYNSDYQEMTGLKCEIKVGNEVKLLIVYSASYGGSRTSFSMSHKYDATFGVFNYAENMSFSGSGSETSSKININASGTLKKSGVVKFGQSVNFIVTTAQQSANFVYDARLRISELELRLKMAFASDEAEIIFNSESDPNEYLQMSIYTAGGAKVGDFKYTKVEGEWIPYFVYSDGTEVSATQALGMLYGRMDYFLDDLFELMYDIK